MVELEVSSAQGGVLPKDCFISVRVGDVQKLSRFQGSRNYSFKKHETSGFGKIEVFRRVGVCNFALDSLVGGAPRGVDISCNDTACPSVGLDLEVDQQGPPPGSEKQ